MISRKWFIGALFLTVTAVSPFTQAQDASIGDRVDVTLNNNQVISGELVEKTTTVIIIKNADGVRTSYNLNMISKISRLKTLEESLAEWTKGLADDNYSGWVGVMSNLNKLENMPNRTLLQAYQEALKIYAEKIEKKAPKGSPAVIDALIIKTELEKKIEDLNKVLNPPTNNTAQNFSQRYNAFVATQNTNTAAGQAAIAEWSLLQPEKQAGMKMAEQHAKSALALDANNARAKAVMAKLRSGVSGDPSFAQGKGMTPEQVNLIRIYEIVNPSKSKPRVIYNRDLVNTLIKDYRDNIMLASYLENGDREARKKLTQLEGWEMMNLLFQMRARALYPELKMSNDTELLKNWKVRINPTYVARYFARHFSRADYGLKLFTKAPTTNAEAYANFYILSQLSYNDSPFIDRSNAENSLLVQWGLPRDLALYPAPEIQGWRPYFTGKDDNRFKVIVQLIDQLNEPLPAYTGLDYKIPKP